jgi:hypothetical protein
MTKKAGRRARRRQRRDSAQVPEKWERTLRRELRQKKENRRRLTRPQLD